MLILFVQTKKAEGVISAPAAEILITHTSTMKICVESAEACCTFCVNSDVFVGRFFEQPEISILSENSSDLQLQFEQPEISILSENSSILQLQFVQPEIQILTNVTMADNIAEFTTGNAILRYFLNITGAADSLPDIEIPISSFQSRRRTGASTYLSVVIPDISYVSEITARINGNIQIKQGYEKNNIILQKETIIETDIEEVNTDQGGDNQSLTLIGYKQKTFTPKTVTIFNPIYRSMRAGKLRYRLAEPDIFLNPGDEVTINSDTFTVDTLSYAISAEQQTFEVAEA